MALARDCASDDCAVPPCFPPLLHRITPCRSQLNPSPSSGPTREHTDIRGLHPYPPLPTQQADTYLHCPPCPCAATDEIAVSVLTRVLPAAAAHEARAASVRAFKL